MIKTMTYEEARKNVQTLKRLPTWIRVDISYSLKLILPYKEGMALLAALEQAEELENEYSKPAIKPVSYDSFTVKPISHEDYCLYKMASLMDLTFDEMKKMSDAA